MKKKYLSILSYLLILALSAEEETVEEIVSIASKNPKDIKEVNVTIDIITKNELKRQVPRDFISILSNTLAIDTSSNGGPGQYASIFLRGTNSNHTLVKINGVKINPYTAGGASINNLDPSLIAQIEIGSGPFSSIHGSEAIGGVINISTIQDEEDSFLQLAISGGADNFIRESLQKNWEEKNKSFNILLLNSKTNGFPSLSNSLIDRGYINKSLISSFDLKGERTNAQFSTWISRGDTEYLGFQGDPLSQNYQNTAYSLEVKRKVRKLNLISLNLSSSKDLIHQNQENYLGLKDITETNSHNLEIMFHKPRNENSSFAAGYVQEKQKVNYSSFGTQFEKKLKTNSLTTESSLNLRSHLLLVKLRYSNHDLHGSQESWNINYKKKLSPTWSIRVGSGSAFRFPNSSELYGYGSNINLKPESSRGYEISVVKIKKDSILSLVAFKNDINNIINFDFQEFILKNIEQSSSKGLELRYKWEYKPINGRLLLRYQDPKDQMGQQLIRRSKKSMSLNVYRDFAIGSLNLNLSAFDKRNDFGGIVLPGYSLINFSFFKEISNQLGLSIRLENILDKEYYTASGFNAYYRNQGRSLWLNITYKFKY